MGWNIGDAWSRWKRDTTQSVVDIYQKPAETLGNLGTASYWDDRSGNVGSRIIDSLSNRGDPGAPPPPRVEELELLDPFTTAGEFSKGVRKAAKSSELGKEQLLSSFIEKNSITAGDFSQGSGVAF